MDKFDVFVGRKQELALIDEWANTWDTTHLIAIQGDGGIGKTWLLREVQRRYEANDDFFVVYWDYAEHHRTGLSQIAALYRYLGIETSRFLDALAELNRCAYEWVPDQVERRELELLEIAVDELRPYLARKRLLYLADTTEAMAASTERADRFARQLNNALFVSAGRDIKWRKLPSLNAIYGPDNVTLLELARFEWIESDEFFDAVDPEGLLEPEMRAKLHFLTDGRPILLTLAAEWLARDVPLPDIIEHSLSDLRALPADGPANSQSLANLQNLSDLRERFEFELVDRVRQLKGLLDRAVLYMAHISRRNDASILSALLDLSPAGAEALVQSLAELTFVKYNPATGSCMLHDEMRNLVNRHAWAYIDPARDVRLKLTHRVIDVYYEPRIQQLSAQIRARLAADKGPVQRAAITEAEWEQWRLEAECLYYHLQLGEREGMAYFDDHFAEAQRNNHLMRMQFLLDEMESAGYAGMGDKVELRRAESLRLQDRAREARRICKKVLARRGASLDNRVSAHNTLGIIAMDTDPAEAIREFEAALRIARRDGNTRVVGTIHNNLGQTYSRTSELDRAIHHFRLAIERSKAADNQALVASATNNLAYVYRLQGDLAQADALCRSAMALRQRLGLEHGLAYSYLTKGEIDRDRGDLEGAERYTKLALRSFDKLDEVRGQIMAYRSLANIRRHMEQYDETESYLDHALQLAEHVGDESLLADVLNVYGREQRDRAVHLQQAGGDPAQIDAFYAQAERYLERSLELASRYGDQWLIARSEFEVALAHFLGRLAPEDEILRRLDAIWKKAAQLKFVLLQGYIEEARGEIAERRGDFATAAQHFGLAACLIAQQRGREPERFFDRLNDRFLDPDLSYESVRALAQGILEVIHDASKNEALRALQLLCQQVLDFSIV